MKLVLLSLSITINAIGSYWYLTQEGVSL